MPSAATTPEVVRSDAIRPSVLFAHALGVCLNQATLTAAQFILPVIARKQFEASKAEVLILTATPTVFFALSVFWSDAFQRIRLWKYLALYWLICGLPIAGFAAAHEAWVLLVPQIISCVGIAGYHPVSGALLKRLYPEARRGRVYAILMAASTVSSALMSLGVGTWMSRDPSAFRVFMPMAAGLTGLGVLVLWLLARRHLPPNGAKAERASLIAHALEPLSHMGEVLKSDPTFRRYEGAYMTYGAGWMICTALLPLLVTDKLGLPYDTIAESTQVSYQLAFLAMLVPAGWLLDRLGPFRSVGLSFGLLAFYPLGLMASGDALDLTLASIVFGVAHAGASMGWMLGPVSLAPTPERVPQYVAIHATLVGVRGVVFQFLGVALLAVTGRFEVPLGLAAGMYAWSCWQMWRLKSQALVRS